MRCLQHHHDWEQSALSLTTSAFFFTFYLSETVGADNRNLNYYSGRKDQKEKKGTLLNQELIPHQSSSHADISEAWLLKWLLLYLPMTKM